MEHLMIHDVRRDYFDLDLARYRLTFDDGLFSHYYYLPLLQRHNNEEMLFFIISSFVRAGEARPMFSGTFIPPAKSKRYMHRALMEQDYAAFMRLEEIQELARRRGVSLGVHSHLHDVILTRSQPLKRKRPGHWKLARTGCPEGALGNRYTIRSKLAFQGYIWNGRGFLRRPRQDWLDYIKYDTEASLAWFAANLGEVPDSYCFPFNEHNQLLIDILKTFGFRRFYSARRVPPCSEIICRRDIDALVDTTAVQANTTSPSQ